uniref:Uncharacterized protein n=1 Tax=Zea mays TaxID=4577 RepID=B8A1P3_MAIZE|nr:unknown [Zea mays]ACN33609.1 unknown [Zea mays]
MFRCSLLAHWTPKGECLDMDVPPFNLQFQIHSRHIYQEPCAVCAWLWLYHAMWQPIARYTTAKVSATRCCMTGASAVDHTRKAASPCVCLLLCTNGRFFFFFF